MEWKKLDWEGKKHNMNINPMGGNSGSVSQGNFRGSVGHTSGVFAIRVAGSQGVL